MDDDLCIREVRQSNFSNREATLELLQQLHSVTVAEHDELMTFIRAQKLYGRGVGYVDVQRVVRVFLRNRSSIAGDELHTRKF